MSKKRFLIWIPFSLLLCYTLGMVGYEAMLSFVNYRIVRGVSGSEFIGLKNYQMIFSRPEVGAGVSSSIMQTLLYMLPAMGIGMLLSFLFGLIPSRKVKSALAGSALLVTLIPTILVEQGVLNWINGIFMLMREIGFSSFPINALVDPTATMIVLAITNMIPQIALVMFAGLSLSISTGMSPWKGALIAGLLPMMTLFTPSLSSAYLASTAMNRAATDNLPMLVFRYGMMNGQFSRAAAISTVARLLNLVMSVLPMLLIGFFVKSDAKNLRVREERHSWGFEMLITFGAALVLALVYVFAKYMDSAVVLEETLTYALNSAATGVIALIVGFLVCFLFIALSRYAEGKTSFVFAIMLVLLSMISNYLMSGYIAFRNMGMMNTFFGAALGSLSNPIFLMILLVLLLQRPATMRQTMFLTLGGAFIAAACCMGDYLSGTVMSNSRSVLPLATVLRQLITQGNATMSDGTLINSADAINSSKFLLAVLVAVAAVPGVAFVMGGVGGVQSVKEWEASNEEVYWEEEPVEEAEASEADVSPDEAF